MFTDDDRRTLYNALEQSLGPAPAAILMAHLPPVGWVELATKADLAAVRADVVELRGELKAEIADLRSEVHSLLPKVITANIAAMLSVAGLVVAVASTA